MPGLQVACSRVQMCFVDHEENEAEEAAANIDREREREAGVPLHPAQSIPLFTPPKRRTCAGGPSPGVGSRTSRTLHPSATLSTNPEFCLRPEVVFAREGEVRCTVSPVGEDMKAPHKGTGRESSFKLCL